jgi:CheY-like chemotaxis protein
MLHSNRPRDPRTRTRSHTRAFACPAFRPTAQPAHSESDANHMKTILLLEDDPYEARLVIRLMERQGYRVLHAPDGESGLRLALGDAPDIVLLDLGLPDLDGQTVAAFLKSIPSLAQVPLVAVTAWPPDTARQMAEAYGCNGYISKPISPREFPGQVASYLKSANEN